MASASSAAVAQPPSEVSAAAVQRRDEWRRGRTPTYLNDFGELGRYRRANALVKPPSPDEKRVVFLGDSITDAWRLEQYFPGKPYFNRGIGGQTTAQMLVRFRQDVIQLQPRVVVILAGTNDIAGNTGPMTLEEIEGHYASMAELARAHGIRVVFSSVLPVHNYTPQSGITFPLRAPEKILELNRWLKNACTPGSGHVYLDYFAAMVDEQGLLKRNLAEDGLHPNKEGFSIMAALASAALEKVIGR